MLLWSCCNYLIASLLIVLFVFVLFQVERLNSAWASSTVGRSILGSINENGQSTAYDKISLHVILNMVLPPAAQIKLIPDVGFKDRCIDITERQLTSVLFWAYARPWARSNRDDGTADQIAMGIIVKKIFGVKYKALANTQDNVGHLFFHLFLSGTNTNNVYKRGTGVMSSVDNQSSNPCLLNDGHRSLQDHVFFDQEDRDEISTASSDMRSTTAKDNDYASQKARFKSVIKAAIKSPHVYKTRNDAMKSGKRRQKFVLSGTLVTDGIALKLLSYKLTEGKRSSAQPPGPASSPLKSSVSPASSEQALTILDPSVLGSTSAVPPPPPPPPSASGSSSAAPPPPPPPPSADTTTTTSSPLTTFPWSTAPNLKGLPYLAQRFDTEDKINDFLVQDGIKKGVRTLCLDLGVASTATAVLTHSHYPVDAFNLHIPRGPRDTIDRRYRKEQTKKKKAGGIEDIEGQLVSLTAVQMDGDDFVQALEIRQSAVNDYLDSQIRNGQSLRDYYGSDVFKKDKFEYRQAMQHDMDKAVTAVMDMRHLVTPVKPTENHLDQIQDELRFIDSDHWRINPAAKPPAQAKSLFHQGYRDFKYQPRETREEYLSSPLIIGVGDGDYRKWGGQARSSGKFLQALIRRVTTTETTQSPLISNHEELC